MKSKNKKTFFLFLFQTYAFLEDTKKLRFAKQIWWRKWETSLILWISPFTAVNTEKNYEKFFLIPPKSHEKKIVTLNQINASLIAQSVSN